MRTLGIIASFYIIIAVSIILYYPRWHMSHCVMTDETRWNRDCHKTRPELVIDAVIWPLMVLP
jgi:hypothetical protein